MDLKLTLRTLLQDEFDRQGPHALLVWYDPGGTLHSVVEASLPTNVRLLRFDDSYLVLRFTLEREDPYFQGRWLVYIPQLPPPESWLRDWELLGARLQMDLLDLLTRACGLAITPSLKTLLREHVQNARELVVHWDTLLQSQPITVDTVIQALLAHSLGLTNWHFESVFFALVRTEGWQLRLKEQGLWEFLRLYLRAAGGWSDDIPNEEQGLRQRLQTAILLSDLVQVVPALTGRFVALLPATEKQPLFTQIAQNWRAREDLRTSYLVTAQAVEREYDIARILTPEAALLNLETFQGVDELWRRAAVECVAPDGNNYIERAAQLRQIAEARHNLYWARHDRAGYWEPIDLAAKLYEGCRQAIDVLAAVSSVQDHIKCYTNSEGWWQLDYYALASSAFQNKLNENERERLLYPAWRWYGQYLEKISRSFAEAVEREGWQPGQTHFWLQQITSPALTAVLLVDALRYDLAQKLCSELRADGLKVSLKPIRGSLPTITEVGMSALLPGAEQKLEISTNAEKLRVVLNGQEVTSRSQRIEWMEQLPAAKIIKLEEIEREVLAGVKLLIILSREVDAFGGWAAEIDPSGLIDLTERIGKAIEYLIDQGFERVLVTADHGFLFLPYGITPSILDRPAAKICKRRFALGANPDGCIVKSANAIGHLGSETFAFPKGLACFSIQGESGAFLHGGLSLQEAVIPVIEVKPGVVYPRIEATMEVPDVLTTRIALIPVKAKEVTLLSRPRKVVVEINGKVSEGVIELSPHNPSGLARINWLDFADEAPSQATIILKDAESLQVLEEKSVRVEIFL